jgi:hypothetical protein
MRGIRELALQWPSPSMIGFYGSFAKGPTCGIILEYPDVPCYTLDDYFRDKTPPVKDEDINKFWGRLLGLIPLLQAIHKLQLIITRGFSTQVFLHRDYMNEELLNILDRTWIYIHKTFLLPTFRMDRMMTIASNFGTPSICFKVEPQMFKVLASSMVSWSKIVRSDLSLIQLL